MVLKTKNPSSTSGTKSSLRGTTQIRLSKQTLFVAVTGFPGADYFNSPAQLLLRAVRRVRSFDKVPRRHWCWASTSLSQLADGMTYYSCFDFYFGRDNPPLHCVDPEGFEPSTFSMPLRRAPNCAMGPYKFFCSSGPEGIRTPGLLSAIEARSQLRYRPFNKAKRILPEAFRNVNANSAQIIK